MHTCVSEHMRVFVSPCVCGYRNEERGRGEGWMWWNGRERAIVCDILFRFSHTRFQTLQPLSLCHLPPPPLLFQRKMWRTDTQTTGRKQDHRAGNFLRFHWETALITPIFPPTASTELQGFKQYSISLTCYHAGQLLCPGDGVDTAFHYNGWSYFPGVSFFPICSEDGCKSLLIQGIHNVSSAGHVEVPTHKEKPN